MNKPLRKFGFLAVALAFCNVMSAQAKAGGLLSIDSSAVLAPNVNDVKNTASSSFENGEKTPTPEEQGYVKYIIDGKTIYYKESGSLQIMYEPKD